MTNSVDPDQTQRTAASDIVYTVWKGLSVPFLRVITVITFSPLTSTPWKWVKQVWLALILYALLDEHKTNSVLRFHTTLLSSSFIIVRLVVQMVERPNESITVYFNSHLSSKRFHLPSHKSRIHLWSVLYFYQFFLILYLFDLVLRSSQHC